MKLNATVWKRRHTSTRNPACKVCIEISFPVLVYRFCQRAPLFNMPFWIDLFTWNEWYPFRIWWECFLLLFSGKFIKLKWSACYLRQKRKTLKCPSKNWRKTPWITLQYGHISQLKMLIYLPAEALLMQWKISIAEERGGHFQGCLFPRRTAHQNSKLQNRLWPIENSKGEIEMPKSVLHSPLISLADCGKWSPADR